MSRFGFIIFEHAHELVVSLDNDSFYKPLPVTLCLLGLAQLIEISVNRSIYNRKTIIDMKIQKSVTFNGCSVYLFN